MNIRRCCLLMLCTVLLSLVTYSCTASTESTPPTSTPAATTTAPAAEQEATINIPKTASKQELPVIQFTVTPANINTGGSVTLSWTVTNATSVTIDHGVGNVSTTGTQKVSPTAPTTYKLTASNASGAAIKTVSVIVNAASTPATAPKTTK